MTIGLYDLCAGLASATATVSRAGFCPQLSGSTDAYLRADGTWATPASGGVTDGDKGDITVSGGGTVWTVSNVGVDPGQLCAGDDARLSNARPPTAHAASHGPGGGDTVKIDDLGAPDDNTDLNVSASAHGLCPKRPASPGDTALFLRGDGTWAAPPGGSGGVSMDDVLANQVLL